MGEFDEQAEAFGYTPGTQQHAQASLLLRYQACPERRGFTSCEECSYLLDCSLRTDALRMMSAQASVAVQAPRPGSSTP